MADICFLASWSRVEKDESPLLFQDALQLTPTCKTRNHWFNSKIIGNDEAGMQNNPNRRWDEHDRDNHPSGLTKFSGLIEGAAKPTNSYVSSLTQVACFYNHAQTKLIDICSLPVSVCFT
ncbi:hypothetical protein EJB05_10644, partial [Eragrostis curvula]